MLFFFLLGVATTWAETCYPGSVPNKSFCVQCKQGKFSADPSQPCQDCPAGKAISRRGSIGCDTCQSGRISNAGMSDCCAAGSYLAPDSLTCVRCPAGTFSVDPSKPCESCPAGKYTPGRGSFTTGFTVCADCRPGYFLNQPDNTCRSCLAGKYSAASNSPCQDCAGGTFSAFEGSVACSSCPAGTTSLPGMKQCCPSSLLSTAGTNLPVVPSQFSSGTSGYSCSYIPINKDGFTGYNFVGDCWFDYGLQHAWGFTGKLLGDLKDHTTSLFRFLRMDNAQCHLLGLTDCDKYFFGTATYVVEAQVEVYPNWSGKMIQTCEYSMNSTDVTAYSDWTPFPGTSVKDGTRQDMPGWGASRLWQYVSTFTDAPSGYSNCTVRMAVGLPSADMTCYQISAGPVVGRVWENVRTVAGVNAVSKWSLEKYSTAISGAEKTTTVNGATVLDTTELFQKYLKGCKRSNDGGGLPLY